MTEKELQDAIIDWATLFGWTIQHNYDSRRALPGWPDLVLGRRHDYGANLPDASVLFWELKTAKGKVTALQENWLTMLDLAGCEARVIRPDDLEWAIDRLKYPDRGDKF